MWICLSSYLHGGQSLGEVDLRVLDALNWSDTNAEPWAADQLQKPSDIGSSSPKILRPSRKSPEKCFSTIWSTICPVSSSSSISTVRDARSQWADSSHLHLQTSWRHRLTFIQVIRVSGRQDVNPRSCFSFFPSQRRSESLETFKHSRAEVSSDHQKMLPDAPLWVTGKHGFFSPDWRQMQLFCLIWREKMIQEEQQSDYLNISLNSSCCHIFLLG